MTSVPLPTPIRSSDGVVTGGSDAVAPRMPLQTAIWQFIAGHRGQMFCTLCVAQAIQAQGRIDRAVMSAEGRGAQRRYGDCSACGRPRLLLGLAR